jgi:dTDP-4-amino-4,6-dideoxygalactose transaminase
MYKNVNSFLGGMVVTDDDALAAQLRTMTANLRVQPALGLARKAAFALATDAITSPPVFRVFSFWLFRWAFLHDVEVVNNRLKIDIDPALKREIPPEYTTRLSPVQARLVRQQLHRVDKDADARIRAARLYHEGLSDIPELLLPPLRQDRSHVYWHFPIQYSDRKSLVAHAMRHKRDITMSYHRNCADLPCFAAWARPCENARATSDTLIYLPTYPGYTEDEIRKTIAAIRGFFKR